MYKIIKNLHIGCGFIRCYAWNFDRSKIAISPNNQTILIYTIKNKYNKLYNSFEDDSILIENKTDEDKEDEEEWELEHELLQHERLITSLEWNLTNNSILSSSEDKLCYIWTYNENDNQWNARIVSFSVKISINGMCKSPLENKIAISTSDGRLLVYYTENDFWLWNEFRKHSHQTITRMAWNPSDNSQLACATLNGDIYIYNAYISIVDRFKVASNINVNNMEKGLQFHLLSNGNNGFIYSLAWSDNGEYIAYSSQCSRLTILKYPNYKENDSIQSQPIIDCIIKLPILPLVDLIFTSNHEIIGLSNDSILVKIERVYNENLNKYQWEITNTCNTFESLLFYPKIKFYKKVNNQKLYSIQSSIEGKLSIISL